MNPDEQEPQIITTEKAKREYNWTGIALGFAVAGVGIIGALLFLLFFNATKKIATKTAQQMTQVQQAEANYENPFATPTATYQNPFSVASSDQNSNTAYQNPFGQ